MASPMCGALGQQLQQLKVPWRRHLRPTSRPVNRLATASPVVSHNQGNRQPRCPSSGLQQQSATNYRRSLCRTATTDDVDVSSNGVPKNLALELVLVDPAEAVKTPEQLEVPEELEPLKEALIRATRKKNEVLLLRDSLEAEAQEVAQLAITAREAFQKAAAKAAEANEEVWQAVEVQGRLEKALADLREQQGEAPPAARQAVVLGTVELSRGSGEEGEAPSLDARLLEKAAQLEEVVATLTTLQDKTEVLQERATMAEVAAFKAEEVASAAMAEVENAVREEMEITAVVDGTEGALLKALQELKALERSIPPKEKAAEEALMVAEVAAEAEAAATELARKATLAVTKQIVLDEVEILPKAKDKLAEKKEVVPALVSFDEWKESQIIKAPSILRNKFAVLGLVVAVSLGLYAFSHTAAGASLRASIVAFGQYVWKLEILAKSLLAKIPLPESLAHEQGLLETIWLLLTSVVTVPLVCKLPGGSPVLGFLAGGAIIGPHALGIIKNVEEVRHLAELGVVFLLFNIGLELSLERLASMQKFVFGMGGAQVLATTAAIALTAIGMTHIGGPAAVILGGGLALSSTAVAMQVLSDRNESGSRHGRATFSVLLFQDLAVVVLLMLIPLLAPSPTGEAVGMSTIATALGYAAIKAVCAIVGIIAGGRVLVRPMYRRISALGSAEIFSACTLLVVLGTSVLTQAAGLSLALGAFLAGLLLAETEYAMQVESDIAPYKGLLMGLFFMTVGMEISVGLLFAQYRIVLGGIAALIVGKVAVMTGIGPLFGLTHLQSIRAGLLLAAGGEFAFVAFGEAQSHGILGAPLVRELFLVVALSMALTPFLAELGSKLARMLTKDDMKALQPSETEIGEMRNHVIIAGFGRVGQIIGQLLSERLIPFVALDVRSDRVQAGRDLDLPVFFGDAGSPGVLHSVGAGRAACAVITLDTPGANYRTVWAINKHFPNVKSYVRAHDVDHGINLEKAGATAVVPETLEPSLQLAAAVLTQLQLPPDDVNEAIQNFRMKHIGELQELCRDTGSSLGYGYTARDYSSNSDNSSDEEIYLRPGADGAAPIAAAVP